MGSDRPDPRARDPRGEARALLGAGHDGLVLEPSPPAVVDDEWWADDPTDPSSRLPGSRLVTPVPGLGDRTWDDWVAAHPEHAAWADQRWLTTTRRLSAAPATLPATRLGLHQLTVAVLSPARQAATGGKMALRWTLGGLGTPFYRGPQGRDRQVRVEHGSLVLQDGDGARAQPVTTLAAAARLVLDGPPAPGWSAGMDVPVLPADDADLGVDQAAAAWLGEWFGFATAVLETLRHDPATTEPSRVQLWPEHFDAAVECLPERRRAGFGASPGDRHVDQPYLYVVPWYPDEVGADPVWDAEGFRGAVLPLSAFVDAADQRGTALAFYRRARDVLTA